MGVSKRKDGRFIWRFQINGVRYQGYSRKKREAEAAERKARAAAEQGFHLEGGRVTLTAWAERWFTVYKAPFVKASTLETYKRVYRVHIAPELGEIKLCQLRADHIQACINNLAQRRGRSVLRLVMCVLSGILKRAFCDGVIMQNPAERILLPKTERPREAVSLSDQEKAAFLASAKESAYYNEYRLATLTGMRAGEVLGLTWDSVDFDRHEINVTYSMQRTGSGKLGEPKTETSRRIIPLVPDALDILRAQRKKQKEDRLKAGSRWKQSRELSGLVFTSARGRGVHYESMAGDIRSISAGLTSSGAVRNRFTFHSLRHTFATSAYNAGMTAKTLQKILGHSSVAITNDIYIHGQEPVKHEEMLKVAARL